MSKPAGLLLFFGFGFCVVLFFQEETDDFCIQQDAVWVEGMGLSQQFLFPQNIYFSISNLQVDMLLTLLRLLLFTPICA